VRVGFGHVVVGAGSACCVLANQLGRSFISASRTRTRLRLALSPRPHRREPEAAANQEGAGGERSTSFGDPLHWCTGVTTFLRGGSSFHFWHEEPCLEALSGPKPDGALRSWAARGLDGKSARQAIIVAPYGGLATSRCGHRALRFLASPESRWQHLSFRFRFLPLRRMLWARFRKSRPARAWICASLMPGCNSNGKESSFQSHGIFAWWSRYTRLRCRLDAACGRPLRPGLPPARHAPVQHQARWPYHGSATERAVRAACQASLSAVALRLKTRPGA
jgi:hypothetical protein